MSKLRQANTIDEVISILNEIIENSESNKETFGYFAALYQQVTVKVKEGIESDFFDDGERMERLDVIFANRYIAAYYSYQNNESVTASWQKAFALSSRYWPIVLQHLLIGMNAHINLDLGIAAAEVMKRKNIESLENDFNKINEILSSLVIKVENDLAAIWPTLKVMLKLAGKVDNFLVDFSMKLARDGAWKFAKSIANKSGTNWEGAISQRDQKVARNAKLITNPGILISLIFGIVRLGEWHSIPVKIRELLD
ncbi:MAG: hypothetical protein JXR03_13395 [Cyclobacteriaceae bacterium]